MDGQLPFKYQLLAGAVAGFSEISVMYPLDGIYILTMSNKNTPAIDRGEVQQQTNQFLGRHCEKRRRPGRLYRGILAPILVEAPKRAVKFASNDQYTRIASNFYGNRNLPNILYVTCGVSAGITEAFAVVSMELIKVRMQDSQKVGQYRNVFDCILQTVKAEGFRSLFRGLEATIFRHAAWNGGYFGSINPAKRTLAKIFGVKGETRNFLAGTAAGIIGTVLNTPFDVVKTRVQNGNGPPAWTLAELGFIAKNEGLRGLYKGFAPKVLRLGPGGGILYVVYNKVCDLLRTNI